MDPLVEYVEHVDVWAATIDPTELTHPLHKSSKPLAHG